MFKLVLGALDLWLGAVWTLLSYSKYIMIVLLLAVIGAVVGAWFLAADVVVPFLVAHPLLLTIIVFLGVTAPLCISFACWAVGSGVVALSRTGLLKTEREKTLRRILDEQRHKKPGDGDNDRQDGLLRREIEPGERDDNSTSA